MPLPATDLVARGSLSPGHRVLCLARQTISWLRAWIARLLSRCWTNCTPPKTSSTAAAVTRSQTEQPQSTGFSTDGALSASTKLWTSA